MGEAIHFVMRLPIAYSRASTIVEVETLTAMLGDGQSRNKCSTLTGRHDLAHAFTLPQSKGKEYLCLSLSLVHPSPYIWLPRHSWVAAVRLGAAYGFNVRIGQIASTVVALERETERVRNLRN